MTLSVIRGDSRKFNFRRKVFFVFFAVKFNPIYQVLMQRAVIRPLLVSIVPSDPPICQCMYKRLLFRIVNISSPIM